ncbi:YihY/virulence factor BrkB family protein [Ornithinicoccus halotolerans]|uniref:YihY/virulence factor BrkB family protein n=1 Tax=Ornithinicoccus halotolerans TaxID=1748220 RepID=UPI001294D466|nr:YihY/virulence factor BrkB family protein [Ornithinicoccus halotolerans]
MEQQQTGSSSAHEGHTTRGRAAGEERFADSDQFPDDPTDLSKRSWKGVLKRTVSEFGSDQCLDLAAGLTYFAVLSVFPALVALTSLLGVFGSGRETTQAMLDLIGQLGAGGDTMQIVESYVSNMQTVQGAGIGLVLGLVGALWTASNYVNAFSRAMNRIYEVEEGRPIWKLRPWMLLLTLLMLLMVVLIVVALVLTGGLAEAVGSVVGLGGTAVTVWSIAKWPVVLLLVVALIALLYWGTPNVKPPKFRWVSPGAAVAIVTWALGTVAFGVYVANFGNYNATYGALAGVIIGLLWLWLTNIALLFGAEFDAELERGRELHAGLPAEEAIQLPPRDDRQAVKKAEKQEELVAEARRIRLRAARRPRGRSDS